MLIVQIELSISKDAVAKLQAGGDVGESMRTVATNSNIAAAATQDPIWRMAEILPWAGDNLRAVRLASESLKLLSADLAIPALAAFDTHSEQPLLGRVVPILKSAAPKAAQLAAELEVLKQSPSLVEQVREGVVQTSAVMQAALPALELAPGMLGGDGPRNYLLVAQNNAESLALGGSAASQTLLNISGGGKVTVAAQADSGDYRKDVPVNVVVDKSATDLFGQFLVGRVNTTVDRPDFPTAARLLKAFWQRDIKGDQIDGVVSVDPLALSLVLAATGPIKVPGLAEEVNGSNVLRLVLSEAYSLSTDQSVSDKLFKDLAMTILDRVTTGQFDARPMMTAVLDGIQGGNILFWSADEVIQNKVAATPLGGVLPKNNDDQTTVGVFFRDGSMGSKIDYYMKSSAKVTTVCAPDGRTTFTTEVNLKLDLSQQLADSLPAYVVSGEWGSKQFRTQVFIYGPPGTLVSGVTLERGDWKWRPAQGTFDLNRPVASFMTYQKPGGSSTVTATFEGTGTFGPLAVRTTPMVNTTKVALADGRCTAK